MIVVLAAGLLLIAVVLMALWPLLAPGARVAAAGDPRPATAAATPHDGSEADVPTDPAALERAIAERRVRMAEREGRR
jgi:hypothetical protein